MIILWKEKKKLKKSHIITSNTRKGLCRDDGTDCFDIYFSGSFLKNNHLPIISKEIAY